MSFVLTNAPSTFMWLMNQMLKSLIRWSVVIYFDDILIYNKYLEEHIQHVREVFEILQQNKLYVNLKKCEFMTTEPLFLGFEVGVNDIKINQKKVQAILDWPSQKSATEVHRFHGLATFYKQFIHNFG